MSLQDEGHKPTMPNSANPFISETYQLQINALTTIITFLNAIADALGDFMTKVESAPDSELDKDVQE